MDENLFLKSAAILSAISGIVILFATLFPIASYDLASKEKYPVLLSPVANKPAPRLEDLDYTRASNWFVDGIERQVFTSSQVGFFTISIPRLSIENATVAIGGEDLSQNLIQYPGTASPGKIGNTVIFGHSILPAFYDPEDYLAIFSTLPTLEEGDEVKINYDGIVYRYKVEDIFEVMPTDIQVLEQNSNDSYLTLVTCVPPGHPLKPRRLVVRAKIISPEEAYAGIGN